MLTNIYRIQAYDSVIYGYFSVGVIDITLKGRSLTGFTIIVSPNNKKKHDNIILNILKVRQAVDMYPNLNDQTFR